MDLRSGFLGRLQIPAGEGYLHAFAGEFSGDSKTQTATGRGYHCDLASKHEIHRYALKRSGCEGESGADFGAGRPSFL